MRKYLLGAAAGLSVGIMVAAVNPRADEDNTYEYLDLFGVIFEQIRNGYVEEVDEAELIKSAIHGMFLSLDPHSAYLEPEGYKEVRERTTGAFGGLGIEVTQDEGWVKVVSPIDETPAAEAGLQSGDIITHVDGESIFGLTLQEAVELLRGEIDSEVVLTIVREDEEPFDVTIVRAEIKTTAVRHRVIDGIGYLRITNFSERVGVDLETAFDGIDEKAGDTPVQGYVLDLRNNPGGLLNEAVTVSDAFLERGEIVTIRGREKSEIQRHTATAGDLAEGLPVVVLINSGSASASEIVAGALRDHNRRGHCRHPELWEGLGAEYPHAGYARCNAPYRGAVLHALRAINPGAGCRAARPYSLCSSAPGGRGGAAPKSSGRASKTTCAEASTGT